MKKLILLLLIILPCLVFSQHNKTYLGQEADTIRLETIRGANTAQRVGRMLVNFNNNLVNGTMLTTTGSSGPATFNYSTGVLNIPSYGGGVTNSATNNELMKSNGTNAISSGLFATSGGGVVNLLIGSGNSGTSRVLASDGSGTDVDLAFQAKSGGSLQEFWRITSTGLLRNSSATIAVADASLAKVKSYFSTSDNTIFHLNALFEAEQTVATSNSIQGLEGYAKVSHPSGTVALAIGNIGNIELASANPLTLARSLQAGGNITAAGAIGEWDGIYIGLANSGGGSVTTGYGIYVDNFPSGVVSKFNIFTADGTGTNKFSGKTVFVPQSVSFSSNQNNLAVSGTNVRMSTDDTVTRLVTGISSGTDGELKFIRSTNTTAVIAFLNEDSGSTAANRIHSSTGGTLNLNPGKVLMLQFDGSISRWVDVSF